MTWLKSLYRLILAFRRLRSFGVSKNFQSRILKSYCGIFLFKKKHIQDCVADVAGYRVNFLNEESFLLSFNEVFLEQTYFATIDRDQPLIIDCGSNLGMSIISFKMRFPNSRIIAFEPDDETFRALTANIKANKFENVQAVQAALSDKEGQIAFYIDEENPGNLSMSTRKERLEKKAKKSVQAVVLSNYINEEVDLLKMDIEGAELTVMEELSRSGKIDLVKQMAIEYHHHVNKEEDTLAKMLAILEKHGFGYQIESPLTRPFKGREFQNILIYGYRKTPK